MQTLRFNLFAQVHKGLRVLLYDTAILIQQTNFLEEEQIAEVVDRVKLVNSLFAHHAHVEDNQVFPLLQTYAPEIVDDFEAQHQIDHALSEGLEKCLHLFTETNSPGQNLWAGNELLQHFNAFLAFNVEHMKKEETIINACLWRYFSDEELKEKVKQVAASIPPDQNKKFGAWMLRGMGTHELIDWFNEIKLTAPPTVFQFYCDLAESSLPEKKWNEIKETLKEGAMLA